jgi:BMFP domain-containing protein YqiC
MCPVNVLKEEINDDIEHIKQSTSRIADIVTDTKVILEMVAGIKKDMAKQEKDVNALFDRVRGVELNKIEIPVADREHAVLHARVNCKADSEDVKALEVRVATLESVKIASIEKHLTSTLTKKDLGMIIGLVSALLAFLGFVFTQVPRITHTHQHEPAIKPSIMIIEEPYDGTSRNHEIF